MGQILRRTESVASSLASLDAGEIGRMLQDLEQRVAQVAAVVSANARRASSDVPDRVTEALSDVAESVRTSLRQNARTVGAEATRVGSGVWHRVEDEVVARPLVALAIAAAIGFAIGALNRR